ncbi:MAG: T9SS type A sorting domain-containing protein [Bacteroidota bacterium]
MKNQLHICFLLLCFALNSALAQPQADFVGDVLQGCDSLRVNFTDLSTASGAPIVDWEWDFGDGTTYRGQNATHFYNFPGRYAVSLVVVDELGGRDTTTKVNYIWITDNVVMVCDASRIEVLDLNGELTFPDDYFLEAISPCATGFTLEIFDASGNIYPQPLDCSHIGLDLIAKTTDLGAPNNFCVTDFSVLEGIDPQLATITNESCPGNADGAIEISSFICDPNTISFSWLSPDHPSFSASTQDITGLNAGIYILNLIHSSGSQTYDFEVGQDNSNTNIFLACNAQVNVTLGIDGQANITPDAVLEGSDYCFANLSVKVTDDSGTIYPLPLDCSAVDVDLTFTVTANNGNSCWGDLKVEDKLGLSGFTITDETCGAGMDGAIETSLICSNIPLTYSWSSPTHPSFSANTPNISGLPAGLYELHLSRPGGSLNFTYAFTVVQENNINIEVDQTLSDCDGLYDVTLVPQGGTPPYFYTWSGDMDGTCQDCPPGNYALTMSDSQGCGFAGNVTVEDNDECVWPGDTDLNDTVNQYDIINLGIAFGGNGPIRPNASTTWIGQPASDWADATPLSGVNYKHIDTNGDGVIDFSDIDAINFNWGLVHNFGGGFDDQVRASGPPLYVGRDTVGQGTRVALPLLLGNSELPANEVYGLAFTIEYTDSLVEPGSVSLQFNNSWLGTIDSDMISVQKDDGMGQLHVGISRIDGINRNGAGEIAQLFITIEDDILFNGSGGVRGGDLPPLTFNVTNVRMVSANEKQLPTEGQETISRVEDQGTVSIEELEVGGAIKVFPNPVNQQLYLQSEKGRIASYQLFDTSGRLLQSATINEQTYEANMSNLLPGVYVLKISVEEQVFSQRLVVLR